MIKITHKGTECALVIARYQSSNKQIAIRLIDVEDGSPWATATVNLEAYGILPEKENHIIVKNYAENEEMARAFVIAKLAEPIYVHDVGRVPAGAVEMKVINEELLAKMKEVRNG